MILTCKECDTSFNFDERLIKPSGSKVRCSKCHGVFTVYPSAQPQAAGTAAVAAAENAGTATAGLDDLDLNKIEDMLDLEPGSVEEAESPSTAQAAQDEDLNLDFSFDEEEPAVAAKPAMEFEETQELDFSDLDLDDKAREQETAAAGEDDLSFELDLDDESTPSQPGGKSDSGESPAAGTSDELDFELDLDLDDAPAAEAEPAAPGAADDLDFDLDFDLGEEKESTETAAPASGEELDFSLDLDLDEGQPGAESEPAIDPDQTEELELTEADDLAELTGDEAVSGDAGDELDFDLDLDSTQSDSDEVDASEITAVEDEFDLDLGLDEGGGEGAAGESAGAAEEIDLGDLDEIVEDEGEPEAAGFGEESFDLEAALEPEAEEDGLAGMEETEELDLTGLDDALDLEEKPDASQSGSAAEDSMDLDLDLEIEAEGEESGGDAGEFDLSDLDMTVESEEDWDSQARETSAAAGGDTGAEADEEDVEFDLSDLDDMLEIEEEPESGPAAGAQAVGLELDEDGDSGAEADVAGLQESADLELEFEEDGELADFSTDPSARQEPVMDDGFDMGAFADMDESAEGAEALLAEEELADKKPPKRRPKKMGGFFKFLLILVLLGGVGYAGYNLTQFFGIDIPYLDRIRSIRIPYVSDLLGQQAADPGYMQIAILEKDLNGNFVENAKLGNLFVISGKLKNNYNHRRNFITVTGKLFVKGRKLFSTKTVYAGNTLTDEELTRFDQAAIDKFFKNRFGQKRSNMNVKKGQVVPFMIVFSGLPNNLDEYTVEPAGSVRSQK